MTSETKIARITVELGALEIATSTLDRKPVADSERRMPGPNPNTNTPALLEAQL